MKGFYSQGSVSPSSKPGLLGWLPSPASLRLPHPLLLGFRDQAPFSRLPGSASPAPFSQRNSVGGCLVTGQRLTNYVPGSGGEERMAASPPLTLHQRCSDWPAALLLVNSTLKCNQALICIYSGHCQGQMGMLFENVHFPHTSSLEIFLTWIQHTEYMTMRPPWIIHSNLKSTYNWSWEREEERMKGRLRKLLSSSCKIGTQRVHAQ